METMTFTRRLVFVDFLDDAVEAGEGAVGHADLLADFEDHGRAARFRAFLLLLHDALGLGIGNRAGLVLIAEEAGHFRHVFDQMPGIVASYPYG